VWCVGGTRVDRCSILGVQRRYRQVNMFGSTHLETRLKSATDSWLPKRKLLRHTDLAYMISSYYRHLSRTEAWYVPLFCFNFCFIPTGKPIGKCLSHLPHSYALGRGSHFGRRRRARVDTLLVWQWRNVSQQRSLPYPYPNFMIKPC
jgi:hypothetical protein